MTPPFGRYETARTSQHGRMCVCHIEQAMYRRRGARHAVIPSSFQAKRVVRRASSSVTARQSCRPCRVRRQRCSFRNAARVPVAMGRSERLMWRCAATVLLWAVSLTHHRSDALNVLIAQRAGHVGGHAPGQRHSASADASLAIRRLERAPPLARRQRGKAHHGDVLICVGHAGAPGDAPDEQSDSSRDRQPRENPEYGLRRFPASRLPA